MAAPTNTFTSYSSIGNREDLSNDIWTLKTNDTPFLDAIGRTKATATYHEWQTDVLGSADLTNAFIEGNDFAGTAVVPTVRLGNRTQISKKEPLVSGTQEATLSAGRPSEMAYQVAKMTKQLKQDMEGIVLSNQTPVVGDGTTARKLRPVESWYATNVSMGAGGANGSATTARTDGTQRPLSEGMLKDVCQSIFNSGGNPTLILAGPYNRRVISSFNGNATRMIDAEDKKLVATIDIYESDFGTMEIKADRFVRTRTVHVLDTDYWKIAELRPLFSEDLGKTGDNWKKQMIIEYTLESRNEAASGIIADLTTA